MDKSEPVIALGYGRKENGIAQADHHAEGAPGERSLSVAIWRGMRRTFTRIEMDPSTIWTEQCQAARQIEDEFGVPQALAYLVGEKFINFLEASDDHVDFRAALPAFAAEIKTIFEPYQLAEYLETARQTEPFDPTLYDDEETAELEQQDNVRRSAADLLLVERAKEWLLEE